MNVETIPLQANPVISIIVPAFNYGHLIRETLASIASQTFVQWECIIIDDGSTDNTREMVHDLVNLDSRFRYVCHSNQGLSASRNRGIELSRGRYIQFLDADDLLEKSKLEHHCQYLETHESVEIVYGDVRYFRTDNPLQLFYSMFGEQKPWIPVLRSDGSDTLLTLLKKTMPVNTPLIRREILSKTGYFDTSLSQVADWEFWIRCAEKGIRFQYYAPPESCALVRVHKDSMTHQRVKALEETLRMKKAVLARLQDRDALNYQRVLVSEAEGDLAIEEVIAEGWARKGKKLIWLAITSRELRAKVKWMICFIAAPFLSGDSLKRLQVTSVTHFIIRLWEDGRSTNPVA